MTMGGEKIMAFKDEKNEKGTVKDKSSSMSTCRRIVILCLCWLECALFAGVYYGWAALVYIFVSDKIYFNLCDEDLFYNKTGGLSNGTSLMDDSGTVKSCDSQGERLSLAFTVGLLALGVMAFLGGIIFDKYGLLVTRLLACFYGISGYLFMAFASEAHSWMIYPGAMCIAMSCALLIITNTHVAQLAGGLTSFMVTLMAGTINSSASDFLVAKVLYEAGIPRKYSMSVHAGLWILPLFTTFVVLPKYKVSAPTTTDDSLDRNRNNSNSVGSSGKVNLSNGNSVCEPNESWTKSGAKLVDIIFSKMHMIFLFWFCTIAVSLIMFYNTFNRRVHKLVHGDDDKVSRFTNAVAYAQACSILISPISGLIMDIAKKQLRNRGRENEPIAAVISVLICIFAVLGLNVIHLVLTEPLVYLNAFMSEVVRSFLYSTAFAFIELIWPAESYGTLVGAALMIHGFACMMQYPYFIWIRHSGYFQIDLFLLLTCVTSLVFPVFIVWQYYKSKRIIHDHVVKVTRF